MKPGPSLVCSILLSSLGLDDPPLPLKQRIADIALKQKWSPDNSDAFEKAERWERGTMNLLEVHLGNLNEVGRPARIAFNSSSNYMIQGACFIEPGDSTELREKKRRRLGTDDYYDALQKLTPEQFEDLCGKLIGLFGVDHPQVTRRSADEGIDFFGRLNLDSVFFPHDLRPTVQKQLTIWMVGQAKRYIAVQAGTPDIRDLVGAIALGRAGVFGSKEIPFPDLKIRIADPVFALFVTSGELSHSVWRLLIRSGVIGMDGEMLAAFLADRNVGSVATGFDNTTFLKWLRSS